MMIGLLRDILERKEESNVDNAFVLLKVHISNRLKLTGNGIIFLVISSNFWFTTEHSSQDPTNSEKYYPSHFPLWFLAVYQFSYPALA